MGKNVWVLTQSFPYEGEGLFGVYDSRAEAERACESEDLGRSGVEWCIYEVEVGAAPRWYGWDDRLWNRDVE